MINTIQGFLAILVSAGFFTCIFYMLNWEFPATNKDALNALLGVLTTIFTLIMNFFFGSSSSSKAKDDTIGAIASSVPTAAGGAAANPPTSPISIPNAETVKVETKEGSMNVTSTPKEGDPK